MDFNVILVLIFDGYFVCVTISLAFQFTTECKYLNKMQNFLFPNCFTYRVLYVYTVMLTRIRYEGKQKQTLFIFCPNPITVLCLLSERADAELPAARKTHRWSAYARQDDRREAITNFSVWIRLHSPNLQGLQPYTIK